MCSLHLTHPSAHTPRAVGSRHSGARGAVGGLVPCSRVSPQSWKGTVIKTSICSLARHGKKKQQQQTNKKDIET